MNRIQQAQEYIEMNRHRVDDRFRHTYHLMGDIGWINDPNGFSFFQDNYHLFFQYHPFSSEWGPMHWGHAISRDLIKWEQLPIAIAPKADGPEGGTAFSGTALVDQDVHYLMYTENWPGRQVQNIVRSTDGVHYEELQDKPVLTASDIPDGLIVSADFRDPKIWKQDGRYHAIVGARSAADRSGLLLYFKSDNLKDWTYMSTIAASDGNIGDMWECPDVFDLDGKDVLLVNPHYLPSRGHRFHNVHSSLYLIGRFDTRTGTYHHNGHEELDAGFDFYAPQTMMDPDGRRILVAWMSMWERNYPTHELGHQWNGSITLPRVLTRKGDLLLQQPVPEIERYRTSHVHVEDTFQDVMRYDGVQGAVLELDARMDLGNAGHVHIDVFVGAKEYTRIAYDKTAQLLTFDRSHSGLPLKGNPEREPNNGIRTKHHTLQNNRLRLRIFLDRSSVEVFIDDGRTTFTARVFPSERSDRIAFFADDTIDLTLDKWTIEVN